MSAPQLENGHRIPGYVTDALIRLHEDGLVVAAPNPMAGGLARAVRTDAGTIRYQRLCEQRQKTR